MLDVHCQEGLSAVVGSLCRCDGLVLSRDCERWFCDYGLLSPVCIPDCVGELPVSDCAKVFVA